MLVAPQNSYRVVIVAAHIPLVTFTARRVPPPHCLTVAAALRVSVGSAFLAG